MNIRKILLILAILLLLPFTIKVFGGDFRHGRLLVEVTQTIIGDDLSGNACSSRAAGLADVAIALRVIGASPREVIVMFQAATQAPMLRAELVTGY